MDLGGWERGKRGRDNCTFRVRWCVSPQRTCGSAQLEDKWRLRETPPEDTPVLDGGVGVALD